MPSFLGKIRDYDRLEKLLREREEELEALRRENETLKEEIARIQNQLRYSQERVREERRRRAEEEKKRGSLQRELDEAKKQIESLKAIAEGRHEKAAGLDAGAVLLEEVDLSPEQVKDFVERYDPGSGEHLSIALPSQERSRIFSQIPQLSEWAHRIERNDPSLIAFCSGKRALVLAPPIPVSEVQEKRGGSFDLEVLSPFLSKPTSCFISIHRDMYVVCTLDGAVDDIVYERKNALARAKKGGFSQARFSRFREDQFRHLVSEAAEKVREAVSSRRPEIIFIEADDRAAALMLKELSNLLPGRPVRRVSLRSKPTRSDLESLPKIIWRWRAWVFDLKETSDQPSG